MKVHFIAIAGSAMHNLALALHNKGYQISGSDDEITEPAKSRLEKAGILPAQTGWFPEKINKHTDAVILGMHARADNPELLAAIEQGIKVYSYPEYLYEQSKNKTRVVIGGSHGKTTITSMILHVLKNTGKSFDYMVGAQLEGFDTMVKLTAEAPVIILEGDEYLTSPIDRRPKFHWYKPHVALLSGIAWDHINVFPTFENYVEQFRIFINQIEPDGKLIYCLNDAVLKALCEEPSVKVEKQGYTIPPHEIRNGKTLLKTKKTVNEETELHVFGEHNLMNLEGARLVCEAIGVKSDDFYAAIASFKGAAKRLELIARTDDRAVYKDFAHSPSKLKATVEAVCRQYPEHEIVACMELHTFSSLNENFLNEYAHSMDEADEAIVYFNPKTIEHKRLKPITEEMAKAAFQREDLKIFTDSAELKKYLTGREYAKSVLLMMSSGTFDGIDLKKLALEVTAI